VSAEVISLCERRKPAESLCEIDLHTAVDVAIRDLREIQDNWGTSLALERLAECRELLHTIFAACTEKPLF
jgi:hypothetical protein